MSLEVPAKVPTAKICTVCGTDVSGKKRTKDRRGRYYCNTCWDELVERHRQQSSVALEDDIAALAPAFDAVEAPPLSYHAPGKHEWTVPTWISRLWDTSELSLRQRYKVLGFRYRVGGISLQLMPALLVALMINVPAGSWLDTDAMVNASLIVMGLIGLTGTVLFIAGLAYYAMHKGRSPYWCVAGFVGIPGLLVLMLLPDKWVEARRPARVGY
jgi:hypothetical protein